MKEFEQYQAEAEAKWGHTEAYQEYAEKARTPEERQRAADGLMAIFPHFAACKQAGETVSSPCARALVNRLQQYITRHYYSCTDEILAGLGQMYVLDERFRANIDAYGEGTAAYVSEAIRHYCRK